MDPVLLFRAQKKGAFSGTPPARYEELPHYQIAHRPYNSCSYIITRNPYGTINIAHRVDSFHLNRARWEVSPMGHWFLIILVVPNKHVKKLIKKLIDLIRKMMK